MQIQKGLVKYKDRTDIVCTYALTDEGRQYYFLDNTSMSNGNIIASTVLVEAIDPVAVASSVGVIDPNGTVVIPFENKSIKPLVDGLLLVEVANSTTPSVVEANSLRSDPLAATKLVTTPATIKENINAKMGAEGRFVFNDQFSEATICDYDGNNILDNQYFSFIAIKNNETLYLCKNTVDSPVLEYSLTNRMFVAAAPDAPLDVQNTEVTQETIDGAMQAEEKVVGFNADDITEKDFEAVAAAGVEEHLPVEPAVVNPDEAAAPVNEVAPIAPEVEENSEDSEDDGEEPVSVIPDAIAANTVSEETAPVEDTNPTEEPVENNSEVDAPLNINMDNIDVTPAAPIDGMVEETTPVEENASAEDVVPVEETTEESGEEEPTRGIGVVDESQDMANASEEVTGDEFNGMVVPEDTVEETTPAEESAPVEEAAPVEEITAESAIDSTFEEAMARALESQPVASELAQESATDETVENDKLMDFDFADDSMSYSNTENEADVAVDDMVSDFKNDLFNEDLESDIFADSTLQADKIDVTDNYSDFEYKMPGAKDSIIEDVASTMSNLIRQNKAQKDKIALYEEKLDQAASSYKKVVEKAKLQLRDSEVLKNKVKNFETLVTKLEAKLEVLENKVRDQDRVIASQTRELESLRPQVEGKEELVKILADAQNLLDQSI